MTPLNSILKHRNDKSRNYDEMISHQRANSLKNQNVFDIAVDHKQKSQFPKQIERAKSSLTFKRMDKSKIEIFQNNLNNETPFLQTHTKTLMTNTKSDLKNTQNQHSNKVSKTQLNFSKPLKTKSKFLQKTQHKHMLSLDHTSKSQSTEIESKTKQSQTRQSKLNSTQEKMIDIQGQI